MLEKIVYRKMCDGEEVAVSQLIHEAFCDCIVRWYTKEGIRYFLNLVKPESIKQRSEEGDENTPMVMKF